MVEADSTLVKRAIGAVVVDDRCKRGASPWMDQDDERKLLDPWCKAHHVDPERAHLSATSTPDLARTIDPHRVRASSAPQLLPAAVNHIGQALPPGAGAGLLRSVAYFNGNGATVPLAVLIAWIVFGFGAIILGHHAPIRFTAQSGRSTGQANGAGPVEIRAESLANLLAGAATIH